MDGRFWDEMYGVDHDRYGDLPNAFLTEAADRIPAGGRVLCVGDGEGRNGVWLAEQGFRVTTVDLSEVGVDKARARAARRGVTLDARVGRFPDAVADEAPFDAVVLVYVHAPPDVRPGLHHAAVDALAPGGVVILEAFSPEQLGRTSGGPPARPMLYTLEDLDADFSGLEVQVREAREVVLDEGPGHRGPAAVVRWVGRRP